MKPRNLNPSRISFPLATTIAVLLATQSVHAGTIWDGGGGDTSINTAANWDGTAPGVQNALDGSSVATFGTGGSTATINVNASFSGITINRDANFTIANGTGSLTLGTGGITVNIPTATNGRSHTISESNLLLNGSQSWAINNNASGAYATLTVSSAISEAVNGSSLTKSGGGTLVFSGTSSNTYTGGTTISGGTLVFRNLASKAGTGTHAFGAGTTLGLGVGSTGFFSTTDVDNAFTGTMTGNLSNVTVDATTNVGIDTTAGTLAYNTAIGEVSRGLTKLGSNTLTLGNTNNAYTGVTTVEGGTLSFSNLTNAGTASSVGNFATAGATGIVLRGGTLNYTGASVTTNRGFTTSGPGGNTIQVGTGVNLVLGDSIRNDTVNSGGSGLNFAATGAGSSITISKLSSGSATNGLDFGFSGTALTATINAVEIFGPRTMVSRTGSGILNIGTVTGSISGSTSNNTWFGSTNITGAMSGLTGDLFFQDANTVSGTSSYNARISIRGLNNSTSSVLTFNSIKNVGIASSLGAPLDAERGTINFGTFDRQATMRYNGTGDTTNRVIQINSRTGTILTIEQAGTGLIKFTSNFTLGDSTINGSFGSRTLRLTGSTTGTGEIAGILPEWNAATNRTDVEKTGTGTWILSGNNSVGGYTGTTTVTAGTLLINGSTSTGLVTVGASGTLGGTGTIGGATTVSGTLSPGLSPGTMTYLNTLTLAGSTVMEVDGNSGAGATGGHDFVNLTGVGAAGVLTYGGTMTLDIGAIFGVGTYTWDLFNMASETGTFISITLVDQYTGGLLDDDLNGVWDLTSGNNTWRFTESTGVLNLTVVPEPAATLLGGLGLLALLRRRR